MVGIIFLTLVLVGGLVYLGYAIKNAPTIDEPEDHVA